MQDFKLHTLETIKLADFIDLFLGDVGKVVREGRPDGRTMANEAARLCQQYVTIVAGRAVAGELVRRNDILKIEMRTKVLDVARVCMAVEDWKGAAGALAAIGYHMDPTDKVGIRQRVEGLTAAGNFQLERMRRNAGTGPEIDRSYFTRERVAVMQYAKMYIDPAVFTAAEYAYMVKGMCETYTRIKQQQEATKNKKR